MDGYAETPRPEGAKERTYSETVTTPKDQYLRECKVRLGTQNPERMRVAHWEWMVRTRSDPYSVRQQLGIESHYGTGNPDWCFDRFGMTRTPLPDGRIICIGGEHEDGYDPDFCIYNDVVVLRPPRDETDVTLDGGGVEIYGYPAEAFPPTDFHTATLVCDRIIVIGGLGYRETRRIGHTPVYSLDTRTYRFERIEAKGEPPGWIYEHTASYDRDRNSIFVRFGRIVAEPGNGEPINPHLSVLHLDNMRWERVKGALD